MSREYKNLSPGRRFRIGGRREYFRLEAHYGAFSKWREENIEELRKELKDAGYYVRVVTDSYDDKMVYSFKPEQQ